LCFSDSVPKELVSLSFGLSRVSLWRTATQALALALDERPFKIFSKFVYPTLERFATGRSGDVVVVASFKEMFMVDPEEAPRLKASPVAVQ
jgi:hypothetical protein